MSSRSSESHRSSPFIQTGSVRGLDLAHYPGYCGKRYRRIPGARFTGKEDDPFLMPATAIELMNAGGGFLDYDRDGDLDIYLTNGADLDGPHILPGPPNRLLRNDGNGNFEDVTEEAGVGDTGFGQGIAVGDIDNDGDLDLYATNYGGNALYVNRGDGTFEESIDHVGGDDHRWSMGAVFLDFDGDSDLDLFVSSYMAYDPTAFTKCSRGELEIFCSPTTFEGLTDRLFRNELIETGILRLTDISAEAGIDRYTTRGLGVIAGDIDHDGDQDLFVASDRLVNRLYLNESSPGEAHFVESAEVFGCAVGSEAAPEGCMGVDLGDFDLDTDPDLVVTNYMDETSSIYRNEGGLAMSETSRQVGLDILTKAPVSWGVRFFDFDLDGDLDLIMANGHMYATLAAIDPTQEFEQPDLLFENDGGRFRHVTDFSPLPLRAGRSVATGDIDNDGDLDVLITNNRSAPYLLENVLPTTSVIGLRLEGNGTDSNRDAYGTRVSWLAAGKRTTREVRRAGSYLSSQDDRLLLGGLAGDAADIEIRWPSGIVETFVLQAGSYHHVLEGRGVVASDPFKR